MKDYSKSHEFSIPMPDDYKHIWALGKSFGSMDYYIDAQIKKARAGKAPLDAIYYDDIEGKWHTIGDSCEYLQRTLAKIISEAKRR